VTFTPPHRLRQPSAVHPIVGPRARPDQIETHEWDDALGAYRVVAIRDTQPSRRKPRRDWLAGHRLP
jgi:hypothetical protein